MDTEIKVLGVFPVQAVVTDLAELFRQETGHTVTLAFTTSGVIRQKLEAGEPADVIILNDYEIDELVGHGVVAAGTRTDITRFGLGVAVRRGRAPARHLDAGSFEADALVGEVHSLW